MSRERRHEAIETAVRTVGAHLREAEVARRLHGLPPGESHRIARPDGPPDTWPSILPGSEPALR